MHRFHCEREGGREIIYECQTIREQQEGQTKREDDDMRAADETFLLIPATKLNMGTRL